MRIPPTSIAFTLLLGFLVALPSFGIDMSLPALTATGATLHVAPAQLGLAMSLFVLGFAIVRDLFEGHAARTKISYVTMPLPVAIPQLVLANVAFGLITPNAIERVMQPLPQIAGAAGAAMGCIQMAMGAVASGLVAALYDGHSALSMTALMALCSLLALAANLLVGRPAQCAVPI